MPSTSTEYIISIRICFPEAINSVLKKEKERFVNEFGSKYKSEPHITLYLGRYTKEGFPKLIQDLKDISFKRFSISLLNPKMIVDEGRQRNIYVMDMSNKEQLQESHSKVLNVAIRYRDPLLRVKDQERLEQGVYNPEEVENLRLYGSAHVGNLFNPHITIGAISLDNSQPKFENVQENLKEVIGKKIDISGLVVFFHEGKPGEEKAKQIEEVPISYHKLTT